MSGKGGKGRFALKRPEATADLEHVAAAFKMLLDVPEGGIVGFVEEMKGTETSEVFAGDTFDLVMAAVSSHATCREGKKAQTNAKS